MRLIACLLLCALTALGGELPFVHPLFTSNMVLQRELPCPVWGWSAPGDTVTVDFAGQTKTATAGTDGRWQVTLDPLAVSAEGRTLTVTGAAGGKATLDNVLVGDVWLCSGQSNMELGIGAVDQWWNELPKGEQPEIRLYWVRPNSTPEPAKTVIGQWYRSTDGNLLHLKAPVTTVSFSAIAWMFGRELHRQLKVPIGVIESDQGNTAIQSWSTLASLRKVPRYGADLDPWPALLEQVEKTWRESDPRYEECLAWREPGLDDSGWATMDIPVLFRDSDLKGFTGFVWFRRTVELPADWAGHDLRLHLSPVYSGETTFVNGQNIGVQDGKWSVHAFTVPAALAKAGPMTIAIRVCDGTGFTGTADEMWLARADGQGEPISLAGAWKYQRGSAEKELTGRRRQSPRIWLPTGLFNGMIAPLAPLAIKGITWYQGEGNVGYSSTYYDELTMMIADWRALFDRPELPFYIVQLADFGRPPSEPPAGSGWANVREAQYRVSRDVPHSGLAVAIDRGEIQNIHPPNKRDVANRLAWQALAKTYGLDIPCEGPAYREMAVEGNAIRIRFDHAEGLKSLGSGPTGFAIAGADQRWVWANARIDGESVVVSSPEVAEPVAVRYGWGDYIICNLYNQNDLPAVPFRTNSW